MVTRYVNTASTAGGNGTTNDTVGANRAFASIVGAENTLRGSNFNDDLEILCCGSTEDTIDRVAFIFNTYVTVSHRVSIKANRNELTGYHGGKWNTGTYRIRTTSTSNPGLWLDDGWTAKYWTLDGIQFEQSGANRAEIQVDGAPTNFVMKDCLLRIATSVTAHAVVFNGHASLSGGGIIQNCVFSCNTANLATNGFWVVSGSGTWNVYNCAFQGFGVSSSGFNLKISTTGNATVKNCSSFNSRDDFDVVADGTAIIDHCASDDGDGTNPIAVASWATQFYNANYVADVDYRIKAGTSLYNAGVGPSADGDVPALDIVGDVRSGTLSSVGPFQNRVCDFGATHGSTGGQYWTTRCLPSKHYVKYSRSIADYPGATGLIGQTGIGVPGVTGVQGLAGEQGTTGVQGVTGPGLDGVQGLQGPTGIQGPTGLRGQDGVLPGVTGITSFGFFGGDTSIQVGYRGQFKLPYSTVFGAWETVLSETGTFVTEVSVGSYADWSSSTLMNTGTTGPHVIDGIKNNGTTVSWAGTTGAYGEYLQVKVLQSTVKQASIVLKHYEKR